MIFLNFQKFFNNKAQKQNNKKNIKLDKNFKKSSLYKRK